MANLKIRLEKLYKVVEQADEDMPIILVWATLPTDKPVDEPLLAEFEHLEFEPYSPSKLEPQFAKATTLGELGKLCKKYDYGLDIMPCCDLHTVRHLWDNVEG